MNKLIIAAAAVLVGTSCERIIPFDAEQVDPVLVLYADINPNQTLKAHLSRTIGILDQGEPQRITDALVWAEDSLGNVLDTLRTDGNADGFYYSPLKPAAAQKVTIKAKWGELPQVEGSAKGFALGGTFTMDSIGFNPGNGMFNMPYVLMRVTLQDDGVAGYYRLEFYEDQTDTTWGQYPIFADSDDPLVLQPAFGGDFGERIDFDNALFLGQTRSIEVKVFKWVSGTPTKLKISKLDEATVQYERSLQAAQGGGGPFTQPVPIFSNVVGGIGLVGGRGHRWIRE
jgi:hypothetical protein